MYHVLIAHTRRTILTTKSAVEAMDFVAQWRLQGGAKIIVTADDGVEVSDNELHLLLAKEFDRR